MYEPWGGPTWVAALGAPRRVLGGSTVCWGALTVCVEAPKPRGVPPAPRGWRSTHPALSAPPPSCLQAVATATEDRCDWLSPGHVVTRGLHIPACTAPPPLLRDAGDPAMAGGRRGNPSWEPGPRTCEGPYGRRRRPCRSPGATGPQRALPASQRATPSPPGPAVWAIQASRPVAGPPRPLLPPAPRTHVWKRDKPGEAPSICRLRREARAAGRLRSAWWPPARPACSRPACPLPCTPACGAVLF